MWNQPDPHSGFSWISWSAGLLPEKRLIHTAGVAIEESLLAPLTTKAQDLSVHPPTGKLSQVFQKNQTVVLHIINRGSRIIVKTNCFVAACVIARRMAWLYLPGSENSKDLCICFRRFMGKAVPNVILNEILQIVILANSIGGMLPKKGTSWSISSDHSLQLR